MQTLLELKVTKTQSGQLAIDCVAAGNIVDITGAVHHGITAVVSQLAEYDKVTASVITKVLEQQTLPNIKKAVNSHGKKDGVFSGLKL